METTLDSFSFLLAIYQFVMIAVLIIVLVLGIKFILKLFKLMDSQTELNKEKIKQLREEV